MYEVQHPPQNGGSQSAGVCLGVVDMAESQGAKRAVGSQEYDPNAKIMHNHHLSRLDELV